MKNLNPVKMITKTYEKMSTWGKILLFIVLFLIVISIMNSFRRVKEGFQQIDQFILKSGSDVYDDFYADVYDELVFNNLKDEYEVGEIVNKTSPTTESVIVDIGSGTGHHVAKLSSQGYKNVIGVDKSDAMVNKAKEMYPQLNFKQGDATDASILKPNTATHLLCLYFTIYYIKDKSQFFKNAMNWLMPGGYLIVHIVDRDMFDPILPPGNPLILVSPQRYAKKRITHTKITFDDMEYASDFELDARNNMALFKERFKSKEDGKVRKNEHVMYMDSEAEITAMAQNEGFILAGKVDLIKCYYEYQYLYIFQKPE
jgi:SAM-dependent methyltransferase